MAVVVALAAADPHPLELTRVIVASEGLLVVDPLPLFTADGSSPNCSCCCCVCPLEPLVLLLFVFHAMLALGRDIDVF